VPAVLRQWSGWRDLRGAGRDRQIPAGPGLYRIRRPGGEPGLEYVGQTGRSLRGRLGQLGGVYGAKSLLENSGSGWLGGGALSGEAAGHDDDHGPVDVGLVVDGLPLVVADGPPVPGDPR
jgi:hypothetical protein